MGWQKELKQLMELVSTDGFDEGKRCAWPMTRWERSVHTYFPRSRSRPWVASRAATLITDGIRLNCINPGPTDTAMLPHFVEFAGQNIIDAFVGRSVGAQTPRNRRGL